jgi:glucose/arabinose dehydrogenase
MALRRPFFLLCVLLGMLAFALPETSRSGTLPTGFQESVVISGLNIPTAVRFAGDGRVFVAEKTGVIKVFDNLSDTTPTVFADLSTNVHSFWDRGLLGLALHPNFPSTPYVYVLYTHDAEIGGTAPRWGTAGVLSDPCPTPPGPNADGCVVSGRLSRLEAAGSVMTGSEQVLIEGWCQQYPGHTVGDLVFGADGALYVSAGDGASYTFADYGQDGNPLNPCGDPPGGAGATLTPPTAEGGALRSQDLRTSEDPVGLSGTILRVDPATGAGMSDNPRALDADPNARRIIAHGLRNPFRMAIRPGTSEVWTGDVGWSTWEEINRFTPSSSSVYNFGWPCYEGSARQGGYDSADLAICETLYAESGAVTNAHFAYQHSETVVAGESCPTGSSSPAGLAFYNGGNYPSSYQGALFFADYSRDCIWVMFAGGDGVPNPSTRATFVAGAANPVDLQIGPNGDLFYVDIAGGAVRRIRYFSGNQPPTAVASASPTSGAAPLAVNFDGTGSSDPDGDALSYAWDLDGDGAFDDSSVARPTHTYTQPGTFSVKLKVTDAPGASTVSSAVSITANNTPPTPTITAPATGTTWKVGDVIAFSGSANDQQDGTVPASGLSWSLVLQHCPSNCHSHPVQDFPGVASGSFTAPDHEYPSHVELRLTATDSGGLQGTTSLRLDPRSVDLTFQSSPTGLGLVIGGTGGTAPFSRTVIVGSTNSVSATSPQTVGSTTYTFSSWSDAGAQTHNIVAPATATTYTATFNASSTVPVASYSFNAGSGTTLADTSGSGNNGTLSGATWVVGGRYGGALSFDGLNDWVTVPDAASLDLRTGMTVEAWVKPSSLANTWRTVAVKETSGGLVYSLFANSSANRPNGHVIAGGTYREVVGGAQIALNAWTHLAITYDGANVRLYVNGTQAGTLAATGTMATSGMPFRIGGNSVWNEWFKGLIDELRVYNRALSASEIQNDMNTAISP